MEKLRDIINNIEIDRIFLKPKKDNRIFANDLSLARRKDEINLNKYLDHDVIFQVNHECLGLDEHGKEVLTPYNDLIIYY